MSVYQNSYLAESVGYANGHANGRAAGRDAGYAQGWDDAVHKANQVIDQRDATINDLLAKNSGLVEQNNELWAANNRLGAQHKIHERDALLHQEQAQSLRAEYEKMHLAFLGVVSIAQPILKVFARLPVDEKKSLVSEYGKIAYSLQTPEYVEANEFPHNQPLIKNYLPMAAQVIEHAIEQVMEAKRNQSTSELAM